jgi:hypothetical protein
MPLLSLSPQKDSTMYVITLTFPSEPNPLVFGPYNNKEKAEAQLALLQARYPSLVAHYPISNISRLRGIAVDLSGYAMTPEQLSAKICE